jgi:hypothetical protein
VDDDTRYLFCADVDLSAFLNSILFVNNLVLSVNLNVDKLVELLVVECRVLVADKLLQYVNAMPGLLPL